MRIIKHSKPTNSVTRAKPYAQVGAGRLASTLWKFGDQYAGWYYRFNIFWITDRGRVGQRFSPSDIVDLVKLARVLSATLAEDGCLSHTQRCELTRLVTLLDQVIHAED